MGSSDPSRSRRVFLAVALAALGAPTALCGGTILVSLSDAGAPLNNSSDSPRRSADGSTLVFNSLATNVVHGVGVSGVHQVYARDLATGATELVSMTLAGTGCHSTCVARSLSSDGRYVAFDSSESNLVAGDTNGLSDAFVFDRQTKTMTRISLQPNGQEIAGESAFPTLSGDGTKVAFRCSASLVPADTNNLNDVYLRDLTAGTTTLVSCDATGAGGSGFTGFWGSISADGRFVAFDTSSAFDPQDQNGGQDVYVKDLVTGSIERASVSSTGQAVPGISYYGALSADGRYVVIESYAQLVPQDTDLGSDIVVRDRLLHTTKLASASSSGAKANAVSTLASISDDGRIVAFSSAATNLWPGDTNGVVDVFAHDMLTDQTFRVSVTPQGGPPNAMSTFAQVSADGRYFAFTSNATNLVTADPSSSNYSDCYIRERVGFEDLGGANVGASGSMQLAGSGILAPNGFGVLSLFNGPHSSAVLLMVSANSTAQSFAGGVLHSFPALVVLSLPTDALGDTAFGFNVPASPPIVPEVSVQCVAADSSAPNGIRLSNGLLLGFE